MVLRSDCQFYHGADQAYAVLAVTSLHNFCSKKFRSEVLKAFLNIDLFVVTVKCQAFC